MSRIHLIPSALCGVLFFCSNPVAAGELEEMRAMLVDMQQRLQQQQARIEQLEKQAGGQPLSSQPIAAASPPLATTPAPIALPAKTVASGTTPNPPTGPAPLTIGQIDPNLASLYGRVDVFLEYDRGASTGSRLAIESGGYTGSRVGIKGGRELTPGIKAIYQLEAGFFINNGRLGQSSNGTRIFGRQAYVGIEGRLGKLTVGRQYSPYFLQLIDYDAFDNGYGSPTNDGNVPPGPVRYDNAIIYATPTVDGLKGSIFTALGGQTGQTEQNAYGVAADLKRGAYGIGLAYLYDNHMTQVDRTNRYLFAGGSYRIGAVQLLGGLSGIQFRPDSGIDRDWRSWFVGTRIDATPTGQLRLIYGEGYTPNAAVNDRGRVFSAAWFETINQQFKAYLALSQHINYPASALAASGTSAFGYYTINPGDNATGLAAGIQYFF